MKGIVGVLTFFLAVLGSAQAVNPATVRVVMMSEVSLGIGVMQGESEDPIHATFPGTPSHVP